MATMVTSSSVEEFAKEETDFSFALSCLAFLCSWPFSQLCGGSFALPESGWPGFWVHVHSARPDTTSATLSGMKKEIAQLKANSDELCPIFSFAKLSSEAKLNNLDHSGI